MLAAIDELRSTDSDALGHRISAGLEAYREIGEGAEIKRLLFAGERTDHLLVATLWNDTAGVAAMREVIAVQGDPVLAALDGDSRVAASLATDLGTPLEGPPPPGTIDVVTVIRPSRGAAPLAGVLRDHATVLSERGASIRIWQHVFGDDWSQSVWFVNRHVDFAAFGEFAAALPPELRAPVVVAGAGAGEVTGRFVLEEVPR